MGYFPIRGLDQGAWDPRDEDDLIAIRARTAPDRFSKWFIDTVVRVYHRLLGERFKVCHHDLITMKYTSLNTPSFTRSQVPLSLGREYLPTKKRGWALS
jgi:hypothetical protein